MLTFLFALIGSAFIDPENCLHLFKTIVCGTYIHRIYGFASPIYLLKDVVRVLVGCEDLFASIDWFSWYNISFKFFIQALFCRFFTCVYHIYCIRFLWYWNLTSGVLENCQWAVSKPDTRSFFPCRILEGCDKGASFKILKSFVNYSVVKIRVGPRSSKAHWVNHLYFFIHLKSVGDIFLFLKYHLFYSRPKRH